MHCDLLVRSILADPPNPRMCTRPRSGGAIAVYKESVVRHVLQNFQTKGPDAVQDIVSGDSGKLHYIVTPAKTRCGTIVNRQGWSASYRFKRRSGEMDRRFYLLCPFAVSPGKTPLTPIHEQKAAKILGHGS